MNKIWCIRPFVDLDTNGVFARPCCLFRPKGKMLLKGYFDNDELHKVRKQIIDGEVPDQCIACKINEEMSGESFRTQANQFNFIDEIEKKITVHNQSIENLLVEAGNTCNLKCLQCGPMSSYARGMEMHRLGIIKQQPIRRPNHINTLVDIDTKKITIMGGEPFFDKTTIEFLKTLPSVKNTSDILLDINTNLTGITKELMNFLVDNYKLVQIKGSVDGYELSNDYIRYPSKWSQIQEAITILNSYDQVELCLTTSVSNLSLLHLPKLIAWGIENNVRNHYFSLVNDPMELMPIKLPNSIKKSLHEQFVLMRNKLDPVWYDRTIKLIDLCVTICSNNQDYSNLDFLRNYLKKHDQLRGTNFELAFPELVVSV